VTEDQWGRGGLLREKFPSKKKKAAEGKERGKSAERGEEGPSASLSKWGESYSGKKEGFWESEVREKRRGGKKVSGKEKSGIFY